MESVLARLSAIVSRNLVSSKNSNTKKTFIIKIINYEVLSLIVERKLLEDLIAEAISELRKKLSSITSSYVLDYVNGYIIFLIDHNVAVSDGEFAFSVYYTLQSYISKIKTGIIIEYKVSSFNSYDSNEDYQSIIKSILIDFIRRKDSCFYMQFNPMVLKHLESDYEDVITLKRALIENTASFAYQPVINRVTGEVPYYECLLRIPEEGVGRTSAGPYIELAEKVGINSILDKIVLDMAVDELKAAPDLNLSVNISNIGILDDTFYERVMDLLKDKNVASRMIIEITETSINADFEKTRRFVEAVKEAGAKVAIDDFGAGFTSFRQLQYFPVDVIKIDGWFIRNVINNSNTRYLVKALVDMAKHLGIKTVAEFVENGEIAKFLLDIEIDYMQGNFFSPAVNHRLWNKSL
ncbi:MAG: EAL domain-containing protein [Rickettsiaceae bacterium]|nr:EAL domain-containing protein [Rickettsiaceae bacterium]